MHLSAEHCRPEHERPLGIAVDCTSLAEPSRSLLASLLEKRALRFGCPNELQLEVAGVANNPCPVCKGLLDALGPVQTLSENWVYPLAPPGVLAFCYVRLTHGRRVRVHGYGESLVDISILIVYARNKKCLDLGRKLIQTIACQDGIEFEHVEGNRELGMPSSPPPKATPSGSLTCRMSTSPPPKARPSGSSTDPAPPALLAIATSSANTKETHHQAKAAAAAYHAAAAAVIKEAQLVGVWEEPSLLRPTRTVSGTPKPTRPPPQTIADTAPPPPPQAIADTTPPPPPLPIDDLLEGHTFPDPEDLTDFQRATQHSVSEKWFCVSICSTKMITRMQQRVAIYHPFCLVQKHVWNLKVLCTMMKEITEEQLDNDDDFLLGVNTAGVAHNPTATVTTDTQSARHASRSITFRADMALEELMNLTSPSCQAAYGSLPTGTGSVFTPWTFFTRTAAPIGSWRWTFVLSDLADDQYASTEACMEDLVRWRDRQGHFIVERVLRHPIDTYPVPLDVGFMNEQDRDAAALESITRELPSSGCALPPTL